MKPLDIVNAFRRGPVPCECRCVTYKLDGILFGGICPDIICPVEGLGSKHNGSLCENVRGDGGGILLTSYE